jgi:protein SCO1
MLRARENLPMPKIAPSLQNTENLDVLAPCFTRRGVFGLAAGLGAASLGGCNGGQWNSIDISGSSPQLAFTMTRASDGKQVTQADYRGQVVMLYFGYTSCPDICPTTLSNVADIFRRLGPDARDIRFLFVTVDPNRDTLPVLAEYVKSFGPQFVGLRGTPDEIAALTRRYRVVASVLAATKDHPYEVTHSSAIYVFDGSGAARLLVSSLAVSPPPIAATTADLKRLVAQTRPQGFLTRLMGVV